MNDTSFDLLLQELRKQKNYMDQLTTENRTLRQQLTDLRAGRGILIEIDGKRFPLTSPHAQAPISVPIASIPDQEQPQAPVEVIADAPTVAITEIKPDMLVTADAPHGTGPMMVEVAETTSVAQENIPVEQLRPAEKVANPSFLEEAMIDEFSSAMTSPMAVWQGPTSTAQKPEDPKDISDKQKANLRRELMGSFLLE